MLFTISVLTAFLAENTVICSTTLWNGKREAKMDVITDFPDDLECNDIIGAVNNTEDKCVCKDTKMFHIKDRTYGCYDVNSLCQGNSEPCLQLYATYNKDRKFIIYLHNDNQIKDNGILYCNIDESKTNCETDLRGSFYKWTNSGWNNSLQLNVGLKVYKQNTYSEFQINPMVLSESNLLKMSVWRKNENKLTNYIIRIEGNFRYPALAAATTTTTITTTTTTPKPTTTPTTTPKPTTKTSSPTIATTTTSYINGENDKNTTKGKNDQTTIIYIVIPIILLLIITFIICFVLIRKRKAQKSGRKDSEENGKAVKSDEIEQSERIYEMAEKTLGEKTKDVLQTYASVDKQNKLKIKTNDETKKKFSQKDVDNYLKSEVVQLTVNEPLYDEAVMNDEYAVIDASNRSEKVCLQETNVYHEAGCTIRSCDSAEQQLHQNTVEEPIYFETVGDEYGVVEKPRKANENNSSEFTDLYAQVQKHPMV